MGYKRDEGEVKMQGGEPSDYQIAQTIQSHPGGIGECENETIETKET